MARSSLLRLLGTLQLGTDNLQPSHLEDGGPLTDNVVFISDQGFMFLSVQRIFRGQSLQAVARKTVRTPNGCGDASSGYPGQAKTIEKESIERFATLTREEREGSQSADVSSPNSAT